MQESALQRCLLATFNPAKEREIRRLVAGLSLEPVTPRDLGFALQVPEEGRSHLENAWLKAVAFSRASGLLALATDGGLVVPALGEAWDSLRTHRFGGDADGATKARELLRLMDGHPPEARQLFWREALVVARAGDPLAWWEVVGSHGFLAHEVDPVRQVPDFWVAGVWHFPHLGKTYGELDDQERGQVNDHWVQLKGLVQGFLQRHLLSLAPAAQMVDGQAASSSI